jgi:hypothetical protein
MTKIKGAVLAIGFATAFIISAPHAAVAQTLPAEKCGNEGEVPCGVSAFNYVCDTGLGLSTRICGCLLSGPFGGCIIPAICTTCENVTRRRSSIDGFTNSWTDWALKNQRDLSQDEPMNWVMQLGTHNSFNTRSDGHIVNFPNHFYSMSDQLRAGARFLTIDAHFVPYNGGPLRLCHGGNLALGAPCFLGGDDTVYPFFPPGMRYFANGIKEIRNWLLRNLNEIVIIGIEDYVLVEGGTKIDVTDPIATYLGSMVQRSPLKTPQGFNEARWPTRREMLAESRRVIIMDDAGHDTPLLFPQKDYVLGSVEDWKAADQRRYPNCAGPISAAAVDASASNDRFRSDTRFNRGDRIKLAAIAGTALPGGVDENTIYFVIDETLLDDDPVVWGFRVALTAGGPAIDITTDGAAQANWQTRSKKFSVLAEDRSGLVDIGEIDAADVADAADCNVNLLAMDFFSSLIPDGKFFNFPDSARQAAGVWSWKAGDRGQNGECAMLEASSGRWISAGCSLARRFACGRPRSESSLDPLAWSDPLGEDWKISTAAGPWQEGQNICRSEFPGYVLGAPVNGYQNRKLRDANAGGPDLWVNYTKRTGGKWVIERLSSVNSPPVANAGADQTVECGSSVTLNGSASTDVDGDPLSYSWQGPFGTLTGAVVTTTLPPGIHAVLLTVSDGKGGTDTDEVTITVRDTTAPSLTVTLTPSVLWPANHGMVDIVASIQVSDGCDSEPLVELVSITSNEAAETLGAGRAEPDVLDAETGKDDRQFRLRAERSGGGTGRTYTVTYRATDAAGNTTEVSAQVLVPHDASGAPPSSRRGGR